MSTSKNLTGESEHQDDTISGLEWKHQDDVVFIGSLMNYGFATGNLVAEEYTDEDWILIQNLYERTAREITNIYPNQPAINIDRTSMELKRRFNIIRSGSNSVSGVKKLYIEFEISYNYEDFKKTCCEAYNTVYQ